MALHSRLVFSNQFSVISWLLASASMFFLMGCVQIETPVTLATATETQTQTVTPTSTQRASATPQVTQLPPATPKSISTATSQPPTATATSSPIPPTATQIPTATIDPNYEIHIAA
ncbi:MAG: hypothetical protein AB8G95_28975, partial [Anaerolineae bacterium]